MRESLRHDVRSISALVFAAAMMTATTAIAQEPEAGLLITEAQFAEHMRVLELDGFERESAAAFYREYVDQFQKAWATQRAAVQWLDQMQGDRFGGYPYRQHVLWRVLDGDFRYYQRMAKLGGRELEAEYFRFLTGLRPQFAERVESMSREHARARVLRREEYLPDSAHGWSFDLIAAIRDDFNATAIQANETAEDGENAQAEALHAAVDDYEQLLQPLVERLDLAQAGLLTWRDDYRRMTWGLMDTGERPGEQAIERFVEGMVEYGELPYQIRALTRTHAVHIAALLTNADGRRLVERVRRATQPFLYPAELDLARTIATGALSRGDLAPQQQRTVRELVAQLETAADRAAQHLEALYDPIISPETARRRFNDSIRYSIERTIDKDYRREIVNPYELLQAQFDEAVLLWAEEVDGYLRNIRAAIGEAPP